MTSHETIAGDARYGRAVVLLLLVLLGGGGYHSTPFCTVGWEGYVPPNPLPGTLLLMVILSLLFGAALAVFGPRWRIEQVLSARSLDSDAGTSPRPRSG